MSEIITNDPNRLIEEMSSLNPEFFDIYKNIIQNYNLIYKYEENIITINDYIEILNAYNIDNNINNLLKVSFAYSNCLTGEIISQGEILKRYNISIDEFNLYFYNLHLKITELYNVKADAQINNNNIDNLNNSNIENLNTNSVDNLNTNSVNNLNTNSVDNQNSYLDKFNIQYVAKRRRYE